MIFNIFKTTKTVIIYLGYREHNSSKLFNTINGTGIDLQTNTAIPDPIKIDGSKG